MVYSRAFYIFALNLAFQVKGRANVFNTTITLSKPVRFKVGVLLKIMLQSSKSHKDVLFFFVFFLSIFDQVYVSIFMY